MRLFETAATISEELKEMETVSDNTLDEEDLGLPFGEFAACFGFCLLFMLCSKYYCVATKQKIRNFKDYEDV